MPKGHITPLEHRIDPIICDAPKTFRIALDRFSEAVYKKAIGRARQKHRPMDPWNHYEPEYIRGRLIEEIGEFLAKFTTFDNEEIRGIEDERNEHSELFDICALACSLWMAHQNTETPGTA
jgi:hypothetical protein